MSTGHGFADQGGHGGVLQQPVTTPAEPAANNYARFTGTRQQVEARTPAEVLDDIGGAAALHAPSHVDGTDDIQDATAGQKGVMTAAFASKLDGIEALADVTDAVNVELAGAVMDANFGPEEGFLRKTGAGLYTAHKSNLTATDAPDANDDTSAGYSVGSLWIDVTNDKSYVCVDSQATAAVWNDLSDTTPSGSAGGDLIGTYPNPTIALQAVTYAKMQDVSAADLLLGRATAGVGSVEEIPLTAAGRALLDDADASAQRTTLGLGTIATEPEANYSLIDGTRAFTGVVVGVDPTASNHLVTQDYVNRVVNFVEEFFFSNVASDIGGIYYDMEDTSTGAGESTFTAAGLGGGAGQALTNWATIAGVPGVITMEEGVYTGHVHAERTGGTRSVNLYFEIWTRTSGGAETLRVTSENSAEVTSKVEIALHGVLPSDVVINDTDRIIIKWLADMGTGSPTTVVLYAEGTTASRAKIPTTTEVLSHTFVRRDGTTPLTAPWAAGQTISATTFNAPTFINTAGDVDIIAFSAAGDTTVTVKNTSPGKLANLVTTGTLQVNGVATVIGIADGGLTSYDLKVGDTTTPDYGMIQFGNAVIGRTSYNVGAIDLNGAIMVRNIGGPVTSEIEFIWTESAGNTCRFALPRSATGNATYNSRSMMLAGPAPADTNFVKVSYWQGQGIFHNLACDTAGDGADLGVQNDLEVEGDIFTDSLKESTTGAGITLGNNLNFNNLKSIAMACDNGATLPASPTEGQWFLHTPTGRNILYMYDGSAWAPISSFGSMTVYVDETDGTDDQDHGGGVDSNAFVTLQFAVDQIPGLVGGNVIININDQDYAENVIIRGKNIGGNYTIQINGTMDDLEGTRNVTVATSTTCTVDGAALSFSYEHRIVRIVAGTGVGQEAVIVSNTMVGGASVITIAGTWDRCYPNHFSGGGVTPDATSDVVIEGYDTDVDRIQILDGQKGILLYHLRIDNPNDNNGALTVLDHSAVEVIVCEIDGQSTFTRGLFARGSARVVLGSCSVLRGLGSGAINLNDGTTFAFGGIWVDKSGNTGRAIDMATGCAGFMLASKVSGTAAGANNHGLRVRANSVCNLGFSATTGVDLTGAAGGASDLLCNTGSGASNANNANNNITTQTVDAASYGWVT